MDDEIEAFLLSREWRDTPDGIEIKLWCASAQGPIEARFVRREAVFFVPRATSTRAGRREPIALRTLDGHELDAVYFASQRELSEERDRLRDRLAVALESDVKPADRFLMERFVTAGLSLRGSIKRSRGVLRMSDPQVRAADVATPALRALSIDIETDGWDGPAIAIALAADGFERVHVHTDRASTAYVAHADERSLLQAAFADLREVDPDAIVGWSVVEFDLTALARRCEALGIGFAIGRAGERARILPRGSPQQVSIARIPGRVALDGVAMLKNATWSFERYSLDHVGRSLLGRGKKIAAGVDPLAEIRRMHREDPDALAAYNLEDARLARDIFAAADLVGFAIERARLTGLPLDRQGGAVAAFDHVYLPRLHRAGFAAPDVAVEAEGTASPGGYVLDSVPGLYRNVLSFDFRSLYPSIIRTFHVDPLAMRQPGKDPIPGFDGASFAREGAILPDIVATLAEARARAQRSRNAALSRAIKILMNSFYGVLGTPGCRFADARLASSITLRGHAIIERTQKLLEERGHAVIYGDTDSLFARVDESLSEADCRALGQRVADEVNAFWRAELAREPRLTSYLELRFESHYLSFLMPTTRGSERGSKKRYAGAVRGEGGAIEVVVRGLEAVRTDWTPLAREMQRELLRRVFANEEWQEWLRGLRADLMAGRLDDRLVYRKRLRRDAGEYESAPPHVRAARMQGEAGVQGALESGGEIEYLMTTRGPEPLAQRRSAIDYAHYVDKQLAPAADVVLHLLGTSFDRVAGAQLSLF